ncbi:type IV prepilin peptidase/methyltransferase PilD [Aurantivibrio infirmus]
MSSFYLTLTQLPTPITVVAAITLGLLVGSFLNVVILRLPKMMENEWKNDCCELLKIENSASTEIFNLGFPNSHCPNCNHKIRAWENIPVISYLFLKGQCSSCKKSISIRYPIIELISGLLAGYVIYFYGATPQGLTALLLLWALIALTAIDIDTQYLPDNITLPLLWLGLLINSFDVFTDIYSAVYGAIAGYGILWSVYWLFKLLTGKEGMGFGDFKLLAALGAWMGWEALPVIIILSSLVGAVIGIAGILIQGRDKNIPIPFGPYLAIAGFITLLYGDKIIQIYFDSVGLS